MAYLQITDFKSGLDTRKSAFTAPPGSLRKARNVHLTRGAEIEVRKLFVPVYTLPAGMTKSVTTVRGQLYVFGSAADVPVPAGVNYQRLESPNGATLSKVLSKDNFDGKIYAVAEFDDGTIYHYYDGVRVTAWDAIATDVASNQAVATSLAAKIDVITEYVAIAATNTVTVTAAVPGTGFTYSSEAVNGGTNPDQTLTAELIQANVPAVQEVQASGSFKITGGTSSPGVNVVEQIRVDGVDLLTEPADWGTSNSATAQQIVTKINAHTTTPNYHADFNGNQVVISAVTYGTGPNGFVLDVVEGGDVVIEDSQDLAGGVDSVSPVAQVVMFTVGGTFERQDQFTITLGGRQFVVQGSASGTGTFVRTLGSKMYSTTQSLMYFSGFTGDPPVPDPTAWDSATVDGAGFINMSTQDGGSSQLTGLAVYQNRMAVFSRRNIQIWTVDADPANNQQDQVLANIGTRASGSLSSFGDIDVFLLSESGVRSLRARDSSNMASADDVGSPIDGELLAYTHSINEEQTTGAAAISEPFEGRYLLAVGHVVYVFSHFPGAKVSAWTTYELDEIAPGAIVTDWAITSNNLVARVGDQLCLYGGPTGLQYGVNGEFDYEVDLPFMDGQAPSTIKTIEGVDLGTEGLWDVYLAPDPAQPDVKELVAKTDGSTYGSIGRAAAAGETTHFSLTLKGVARGYARLANLVVHYRSHESG